MPIHHALWRVGTHPERLTGSQLGEKQLEDHDRRAAGDPVERLDADRSAR